MTREEATLLRLDVDRLELRVLLADIRAASARAVKALPGDRVDVVRYEKLSSQLEAAAIAHSTARDLIAPGDRLGHGFYDSINVSELPAEADAAAGWIYAGDVAVEVRDPFVPGPTALATAAPTPLRSPANPWLAVDDEGHEIWGTPAVAKRFREQLRAAVDQLPDSHLSPSGVANGVLTDGLRNFVGESGNAVEVPVLYRDGSAAPDFPMRCLRLRDDIPLDWPTYRFAMLSIRHTEMDAEVDGAWLRNSVISRTRPAGDTDRIAYEASLEQFRKLLKRGPALVYMHQTGLDAALVGVYRAVARVLQESPDRLVVRPMYFQRRRDAAGPQVAGYEAQPTFVPGKVWGTR